MIFSPQDKLKGISKRLGEFNDDGQSDYFSKCEDCPNKVCVQGLIADEYSYWNKERCESLAENHSGQELCYSKAREYLNGLTIDQFKNLLRVQTLDAKPLNIAWKIRVFSETGCMILEDKYDTNYTITLQR